MRLARRKSGYTAPDHPGSSKDQKTRLRHTGVRSSGDVNKPVILEQPFSW